MKTNNIRYLKPKEAVDRNYRTAQTPPLNLSSRLYQIRALAFFDDREFSPPSPLVSPVLFPFALLISSIKGTKASYVCINSVMIDSPNLSAPSRHASCFIPSSSRCLIARSNGSPFQFTFFPRLQAVRRLAEQTQGNQQAM